MQTVGILYGFCIPGNDGTQVRTISVHVSHMQQPFDTCKLTSKFELWIQCDIWHNHERACPSGPFHELIRSSAKLAAGPYMYMFIRRISICMHFVQHVLDSPGADVDAELPDSAIHWNTYRLYRCQRWLTLSPSIGSDRYSTTQWDMKCTVWQYSCKSLMTDDTYESRLTVKNWWAEC